MTQNNFENFASNWEKYSEGSYEAFKEFGWPSLHFHNLCIKECKINFLSERHIELIYATLTSWGMDRPGKGGSKLTCWEEFRASILYNKDKWRALSESQQNVVNLTGKEYEDTIRSIKNEYLSLKISETKQTIVANSKALFHILPDLIPPIDRMYTMRFFRNMNGKWISPNGRMKKISENSLQYMNPDEQFSMFLGICVNSWYLRQHEKFG